MRKREKNAGCCVFLFSPPLRLVWFCECRLLFVVVCIFSTLHLLAIVWLCLASRVVARIWCCVGFSRFFFFFFCACWAALSTRAKWQLKYHIYTSVNNFLFSQNTHLKRGGQLTSEACEYAQYQCHISRVGQLACTRVIVALCFICKYKPQNRNARFWDIYKNGREKSAPALSAIHSCVNST